MSSTPDISIRGIRQTIPSGYVLGRVSSGAGQTELIPLKGFAATIGGYLAPAFSIHTAGNGISLNNGNTLEVEWNAGTINSLGTHTSGTLSISGNSLFATTNWNLGTVVSALGTGLTITAGTMSATALPAEWNAGTVNALGTNSAGTLSISAGTLFAHYDNPWQAGTVTTIGQNLLLTSGTLTGLPPFATWSTTDFASGGTFQAVSITNGNLTIQQTGISGNGVSVDRATIPQTTGKFYVEETFVSGSATTLRLGVMQNASTIAIPASGATGALLWDAGGDIINNGTSVAAIGAYGNGSVISQAIDLVNGQWWGRVNGGNWNNAGTANPATNVGGIALSPLTGAMNLVFYNIPFSAAQALVTLNSGTSGFSQTVPSGFTSGWPYLGLTGGVGPTGPAGPTTWNAGSVTALGTASTGTLSLGGVGGTTLSATYNNPYSAGTLSSFGTGLTLTTGVLKPDYSAGTLTTFHSGLTLAAGTLAPDWQGGVVSSLGTGLTLVAGALSTNIIGGLTHPQVMARIDMGF